MSLGRIKVWIPGDILTAADLNAEFNNLLNNPISLVSPTTGAINFAAQAHTGLVPSAITATSGSAGQALTINTAGNTSIWGTPTVTSAAQSRVSGLLAFLSSQTATVTAERYIMRTTDNSRVWTVTATSSFGISIGTSGPAAGGRDIAGAFASTYVHWYAISTGVNSTAVAGIVSTNPPTVGPANMPTSYSGWAYLGASPYTSASTTVSSTHRFVRNQAIFPEFNSNVLLSAGASTSLVAVSYSSAVAPNIPGFNARVVQTTAAANLAISIDNASTYFICTNVAPGPASVYIPQTSEGLKYQMSAAGGSANIQLLSYVLPNGDVIP